MRRATSRRTRETTGQRDITERLLLGALREQDVAHDATQAQHRAQFLARVSRELALTLDESAARNTVRRLTLPRPGSWCIVDVMEADGGIRRLPVIHPDPLKQLLADSLAGVWPAEVGDDDGSTKPDRASLATSVPGDSGDALMRVAHGEENLRALAEIGFGSLLAVPLIVRARVHGAMTFVTPEGDPPFSPDEIALAVDLAARCAMALDNARLYRLAEDLRRVAEAANEAKSAFLSGMSHELRTPLNAIGGYTELLEMGIHGTVTIGQHTALARIRANQKHLLTLIAHVLDFARVEGGKAEYHHVPVSLLDALTEVAGMLAGAATEKRQSLMPPEGADPATAWADPDRVRQILMNVVMNAVKYTPRSGGSIRLSCSTTATMAVAEVTDTGPGIAAESLDSIFEPFVQLTAGLANRESGVGLGLAISRDLARAMGGDLTVVSHPGLGSCFTLTLPLAATRGPDSAQAAPAVRPFTV